jgi:2-hydroxychromene-2-carboxylate isomerase
VWRPILLGGLFKVNGRDSWANGPEREAGMREVERRAAEYGLPPVQWPDPWPGNTLFAMRAATFATQIGKAVSFAQAAFRQAFAGGRDLTDPDNVLIAAAACELHPNALVKAVETRSVKDALRAATDEAAASGVIGVPTVVVGAEVFWGDDRLAEAAAAVAAT